MKKKWQVGATVYCPEIGWGGRLIEVTKTKVRIYWPEENTTGTIDMPLARTMLTFVSDSYSA